MTFSIATKLNVLIALNITLMPQAFAKKLPLFELGVGPGAIYQNYYPGTKDTRLFPLPAIIPIYRGNIIKSDNEGVRAQLFKNNRLKLDLSADFSLTINSDDVALRKGMPDIDNILQLGPSLKITLSKKSPRTWLLRLPIRATFAFSDQLRTAGYTFWPDITYLQDLKLVNTPWRLGLSLGPQFGTSSYHDIFYAVDAPFVTENRAPFKSDSGFAGYRFLATFTSKTRKRIVSWFLRTSNLSGSVFENSPLVETNSEITVGFIYSVLLFKSKSMVVVQ